MSNVLRFKCAEQQCEEYIAKERSKRKREAADVALAAHLDTMSVEHGTVVTLGALMRYVGVLLVEAADRKVIAECRRYLTRKIVASVLRKLLTTRPMLH